MWKKLRPTIVTRLSLFIFKLPHCPLSSNYPISCNPVGAHVPINRPIIFYPARTRDRMKERDKMEWKKRTHHIVSRVSYMLWDRLLSFALPFAYVHWKRTNKCKRKYSVIFLVALRSTRKDKNDEEKLEKNERKMLNKNKTGTNKCVLFFFFFYQLNKCGRNNLTKGRNKKKI